MKKIMFVCHGNICRSPLAEFLFKDKIKELGVENEFTVSSSATSAEELGNPVYPPVVKLLSRLGIDCSKKRAVLLKKSDYADYDYFIGMDERNVNNMMRIFGGDKDGKVCKLMDFTSRKKDVADPYWYGNFEETFCDVVQGIEGLVKFFGK